MHWPRSGLKEGRDGRRVVVGEVVEIGPQHRERIERPVRRLAVAQRSHDLWRAPLAQTRLNIRRQIAAHRVAVRIVADAHATGEERPVDVVNPSAVDLRMAKAAYLPSGDVVAALDRVRGKSLTSEATALLPWWRAGEGNDEVH